MGQEMRLRLLPEALRALRVSAATPTSFIFLFALWAERERRRSDRYANGHAISELIALVNERSIFSNFFSSLDYLSKIFCACQIDRRYSPFAKEKGFFYPYIFLRRFVRFQAILHLHTSLAYGQFLPEDSKFLLFLHVRLYAPHSSDF